MLQLVLEAFLFLCLIFPSLQLFLNPVTERSRVKLERDGGGERNQRDPRGGRSGGIGTLVDRKCTL